MTFKKWGKSCARAGLSLLLEGYRKRQRCRSKRKFQLKWENAIQWNPQEESSNKSDKEASSSSSSPETKRKIISSAELDNDISEECPWMIWSQETDDESSSGVEHDNGDNEYSLDDSISFIASVFIQNNISKNLGDDIFDCFMLLQKHSNIRISDIRRKIKEWSACGTRVYAFCVKCNFLLSASKKCGNKECDRYAVSQANVSSLRTVITFSLRQQMEELLRSGSFEKSILTRSYKNPSISGRLCDTKKYKDRLLKCEEEHPGMITLLLSMNTDGFRKRGCSRGEMWPVFLAAHDITNGHGSFREYNPQYVILSAILQTSGKLCFSDFDALFERMNYELNETTVNPLKVVFDGVEYKVRLELFQTVLDMDASRKIRGLPIWQSHGSCSLCTVEGMKIKTKTGRTISWYSETSVETYHDNFLPPKLLKTCLPPPHLDGFDSLHIIFEGTSKDLIKDLMGTGKRTGASVNRNVRMEWSNALNSASTPRGRSSAALLDPIQLSTRTGKEIQELYDLAIPVLLVILGTSNEWTQMIFFHWITTRNVNDCFISEKDCDRIDEIPSYLRNLVQSKFPTVYTMKFHFFIDHLIPTLRNNGSPHLSSAAPFERMNQVLGRSSNSHTTRAVLNISNRFLAFKRSAQYMSNKMKLRRMKLPRTMMSLEEEQAPTNAVIDCKPLKIEEEAVIEKFPVDLEKIVYIQSYNDGRHVYSVRRLCVDKTVQNCFIYFHENKEQTAFGCIERIFTDSSGTFALIQKFSTMDPFRHIISLFRRKKKLLELCEQSNQFFRQITGSSFFIVDIRCLKGFITVVEFNQNSYVSRC